MPSRELGFIRAAPPALDWWRAPDEPMEPIDDQILRRLVKENEELKDQILKLSKLPTRAL